MTSCNLFNYFQNIEVFTVFKAIVLFVAGFLFARFSSNFLENITGKYLTSQQTMLLKKIIYFLVLTLFISSALQQLNFNLSILLGSAGILTAALAIAAQTSISNIISGIFLLMEKSFRVGDEIQATHVSGKIVSIDLMSVKILTTQNTLVRIPNEILIKTEITNLTHYNTRCLNLPLLLSEQTPLKKSKQDLINIATTNPLTLKTPPPCVSVKNINNAGITLELRAWVNQKDYEALKDSLYEAIAANWQKSKETS